MDQVGRLAVVVRRRRRNVFEPAVGAAGDSDNGFFAVRAEVSQLVDLGGLHCPQAEIAETIALNALSDFDCIGQGERLPII